MDESGSTNPVDPGKVSAALEAEIPSKNQDQVGNSVASAANPPYPSASPNSSLPKDLTDKNAGQVLRQNRGLSAKFHQWKLDLDRGAGYSLEAIIGRYLDRRELAQKESRQKEIEERLSMNLHVSEKKALEDELNQVRSRRKVLVSAVKENEESLTRYLEDRRNSANGGSIMMGFCFCGSSSRRKLPRSSTGPVYQNPDGIHGILKNRNSLKRSSSFFGSKFQKVVSASNMRSIPENTGFKRKTLKITYKSVVTEILYEMEDPPNSITLPETVKEENFIKFDDFKM